MTETNVVGLDSEERTPTYIHHRIKALVMGQRRIERILFPEAQANLFSYTRRDEPATIHGHHIARIQWTEDGQLMPGYSASIFDEWSALRAEIRELREEQARITPTETALHKAFRTTQSNIWLELAEHTGISNSYITLKPGLLFGDSYCMGRRENRRWYMTIKTRPGWYKSVQDHDLAWPTKRKFVIDIDRCEFDLLQAERILGDLPERIFMAKAKYLDLSLPKEGTRFGYLSWIEQPDHTPIAMAGMLHVDRSEVTDHYKTLACGLKDDPESSLRYLASNVRKILYNRIG